ncbi:uncharacterized protein LOC118410871 [Branchiostoma floridae]|uniref:Uncharacterized protein LOC118410871 n=1 Tax=Branchiostoma floridae TaxID=7739 RepID=A0A9J7KQX3_BRAFL|nr:uncharacterized protein LOC118410871 [Branchiostoma floridae]XP_035668635.1 uncharacterized protein LOC118410871 [Branchiostoma floridae]
MGDVEREQEQESGEDNRPVSIMSESTRPRTRSMTNNSNSELDSSCQKTQQEKSGTGQNGLFSTNPGQNDKGQTDPGQHEQGQTDTDQPEQSQADPGQNDQSQTDDPGQHEQSQTDPGQHEQGQTDPGQSDQSQTHSSQNDEDQTDPGDENAQSIPEMKTIEMSGPTRDPQSLESSRECQLEKDEEGHIQEAVHGDASQDTQPGMAASSAVSQAESPTVKGCIALSSAENPASPKLTTVSDQTGQESCHNEQGQMDPGQSETEQTDPVQSEPGQADLVQSEEGQTDAVQSEYGQTYLVLSDEGQTDPVPIEHGQTDPGQIEQDQTDPVESEQGQTYLVLSEEGQTDPVPIEHGQTDPGQIEQGPTDPVQSEQGPTDPVQSEQGQTDPGQSQNAQSNAVRKPVEDCEGLESPMAEDEGQIQVQGEASKDSQSDMAVSQAGIVSSTANPGTPELSEDAGQTSQEAQPFLPGSSSQGTAQQPAQVQSQPTRGTLIREHFCKKLLAFVRKNYPVKTRQNVENRINSFEIELASDAGFVWMHKDNNDKMIHQLVEHLHLHPTSTWKLRLLRRVVINSLPKWSPSMKMQVNRLCKQLLMGEGANARANISQLMKVMTVRLPRGNKQRRGKSQVEQSQTGGQERDFPISRKLSKILSKIEWRLAQGLFINQKDLKMYEKYREELRKREGEIQQQRREGKDVSSQGTQPALAASSTVSHVASSTASQEANSAVQAVGSSDSSSKNPVLPKLATDSNQTSQEPQPTLPGPSSQDTTQEPARAQKGTTGGTLVSEPFCKMLLASVQQHFTEWKKETTKQFINNFEEELKGNAEFLWGRHDKTIEELAERLQLPPGSVWKLQLLRKLNLRGLAKSNPSQLERNMQMFLQILREEFNSEVVDISELMKVIYLPVLKSIKQESEQSDLTKPDRVSDQTSQQSQPDLPGVSSQGATQQPAGSQEEGWRGSLSLNKFSQNLIALVEHRYSNEKVKKKVEHRINKFEEELHTACEWKSVHNNDEEIVKLAARLKLLPGSVWNSGCYGEW